MILPFKEFAVKVGDLVMVDIAYRMCEGLGSLHYRVVRDSGPV